MPFTGRILPPTRRPDRINLYDSAPARQGDEDNDSPPINLRKNMPKVTCRRFPARLDLGRFTQTFDARVACEVAPEFT
jgi:hypothetical protein